MAKKSAALLPFRHSGGAIEVFLVHPGGPFWAKKNDGAWSLAKGEYEDGEDPLSAAQREFTEETGFVAAGPFHELGSAKLKSGKLVTAWAFESNYDVTQLRSNVFSMEWPPRSGRTAEFPEIDRAEWMTLLVASEKLNEGQRVFLVRLAEALRTGQPDWATESAE